MKVCPTCGSSKYKSVERDGVLVRAFCPGCGYKYQQINDGVLSLTRDKKSSKEQMEVERER